MQVPRAREKKLWPALAASQAFARPCRIFSVMGYNRGPAQNIHLFDAVAVPADGALPADVTFPNLPVGANQFFYFDFPGGIEMHLGVALSNSMADSTQAIGAADCQFGITFS